MKRTFGIACLALIATASAASAGRMSYPPEEFAERRARLCAAIEENATVMLFARTSHLAGLRFRQDHDFYYLTGNENLNAVAVIDASSCETWLFLPTQTAREASRDGWNWLYQEGAAERWGFREIKSSHYLEEFLARRRTSGRHPLYLRMSERDEIDNSRGDAAIYMARRMVNPWGAQPSEDAWRVEQMRLRYPYYELHDVSPLIDRLRMIKTPREIEVLRYNGRISAEAIRKAIEATAPGRFEYHLEAAASHHMFSNGAEHAAYPAIVGAGPNGNIWHYNSNGKELVAGETIVMDYGASFAYQTMDITRTWPVSGEFTELQERAYRATLEAQKAIIAAMVPGATREETDAVCRRIYDKWGFEDHAAWGAGHFVGMAVHDVGDYSLPFEPGMVIAVEPIIEIVEEDLHVRIEDTVLITEDGPEILSAAVPKEVDEVLALVGRSVR